MASQDSHNENPMISSLDPDDIVISGISAKFPQGANMNEFEKSLFNGTQNFTPVKNICKSDNPAMPSVVGKISGLGDFDAQFFKTHIKQAEVMDPQARLLLHVTHEAIADAGVNPTTLHGQNTAVLVATCFNDSESLLVFNKTKGGGLPLLGCSRAFLANRISFCLGVTGPSYSVDAGFASTLYALEQAAKALQAGLCDSAVVGAGNMALHSGPFLQLAKLGQLTQQDTCRPFDESADGSIRSDAVGALFLQRARDAKRAYASVAHVATSFAGQRVDRAPWVARRDQVAFLRDTYRAARVDPRDVAYVEAHANGVKAADAEELHALDEFFTREHARGAPLLVGAVAGNVGYAEAASGLSGLAKLVVLLRTGVIPPSANVAAPRQDVDGLRAGRLEVVREARPWRGGLLALSSFPLGGAMAHVILRPPPPPPPSPPAEESFAALPRLALASGRTEDAVHALLEAVERQKTPDPHFLRLLHDLHARHCPGHLHRGFALVGGGAPPLRDIQHFSGEPRPVWFVFSGMGSQWVSMGKGLMTIPMFAESIGRCGEVLRPMGLDLAHLITTDDPTVFDNVLHSVVGVISIQIALVDILHALEVQADGMLGHSVGELGCAYADGSLTLEETMLAAYWRGQCLLDGNVPEGAMAAVGMGAKEIAPLCPSAVDVACHNGEDSCTVSGPPAALKSFVDSLQRKGVFAREVASNAIPYHSRYITEAGELLLRKLQTVIPQPKERSARWLSTSVPEAQWGTREAALCSAEYITNNMLRPVMFAEAARKVPANAVVLEVAPHGLLQAILKRSLGADAANIALTKRDAADGAHTLFAAIGRMYVVGLQPQVARLYPAVPFPVALSTPMLSPLIRWDASTTFAVPTEMGADEETGERTVLLGAQAPLARALRGHRVQGRALLPAAYYLDLVWETLAMMKDARPHEISVVFEDVLFLEQREVPKDKETLELTVVLHRCSGRFEVSERHSPLATGFARVLESSAAPADPDVADAPSDPADAALADAPSSAPADAATADAAGPQLSAAAPSLVTDAPSSAPADAAAADAAGPQLTAAEVYQELRLRGHDYQGAFRSILSAAPDGQRAVVRWAGDWVAFVDALLQLRLLADGPQSRAPALPAALQRLSIDVQRHAQSPAECVAEAERALSGASAGGVEVRGARMNPLPPPPAAAAPPSPLLERCAWVAHSGAAPGPLPAALRAALRLALENTCPRAAHTVALLGQRVEGEEEEEEGLVPVRDALSAVCPQAEERALAEAEAQGLWLVAARDALGAAEAAARAVRAGGWLLGVERRVPTAAELQTASGAGWQPALRWALPQGNGALLLLRKVERSLAASQVAVVEAAGPPEVDGARAPWVARLHAALQAAAAAASPASSARVVLAAHGQPLAPLLAFAQRLRAQPGPAARLLRCYLTVDDQGEPFSTRSESFRGQLSLDLAVNVAEGGAWGSVCQLPLEQRDAAPAAHAYQTAATPGDLRSLAWVSGSIDASKPELQKDEKLVHVYYASVSENDLHIALGKIADDPSIPDRNQGGRLGGELSGRLGDGRRVMGACAGGAVATLARVPATLLWDVPDAWTLEQAATVPRAYLTALYALDGLCGVRAGETVVVQQAASAVGQAAVRLALHFGCRVIAAVAHRRERRLLRALFPQLGQEEVFCCAEAVAEATGAAATEEEVAATEEEVATAEEMATEAARAEGLPVRVLWLTRGVGADAILSWRSEGWLREGLRALAASGRFVQMREADAASQETVGMHAFAPQTSVTSLWLEDVWRGASPLGAELHARLAQLLREGAVQPLQARVFPSAQAQRAYRSFEEGCPNNKVLIQIRPEEKDKAISAPQILNLHALSRFQTVPSASYVIYGGEDGAALELAEWLVRRGAKHVLLAGPRAPAPGPLARRLLGWRGAGAHVRVLSADASSAAGAEALLREAGHPVLAVFHLDAWRPAGTPSPGEAAAASAAHLDAASRRLCPRLRHFAVLSGAEGAGGGAELVVGARRAAGLPAVALRWALPGPNNHAHAHADDDDQTREDASGDRTATAERVVRALEALDEVLEQPHPLLTATLPALAPPPPPPPAPAPVLVH